jgi:Flp pilus assembly protein TadD
LGNILKVLGRLKDAEASYRKTIELKQDFVQAHNNLGVLLQQQGKFKEAEASFR